MDKKITKSIFAVFIIFILFFSTLAGYLYIQKKKINEIISNHSIESKEDWNNKILTGLAKIISKDKIIMEIKDLNGENTYKEVVIDDKSKIYLDFQEEKVPEETNIDSIKVNNSIVIGLTTSKYEEILTAETIHILPNEFEN